MVYLEQWKKDRGFLRWAHATKAATWEPALAADAAAWTKELQVRRSCLRLLSMAHSHRAPTHTQPQPPPAPLAFAAPSPKVSKHEPTLIAFAQEYVALDAARGATMDRLLAKLDEDNSVASFWKLCEHLDAGESNERNNKRTFF